MDEYYVSHLLGLEGKMALITGASSGIGLETAKMLANCGVSLLLVDINAQGLAEAKKGLSHSERHMVKAVNLGEKEEVDNLWRNLTVSPDILINNAGIYPTQEYIKLTNEEYQKTLAVNMNSVFWMCREFIARRGKMGGVIVNVASIEAILPFKKDLIPYCMSKSGVIALTRSIARDYGKVGFRANVVLPGAIKTPGTRSLIKYGLLHLRFDLMQTAVDFQHRLALGRWGAPEEVAKAIVFLASDMASYVQGALIPVDGGFLSS